MDVQNQVIGIVFALCAGMFFLWAVPSYARRLQRRARDQKAGDAGEDLQSDRLLEESTAPTVDPCDPPSLRTGAVPPELPRGCL